MTEIQNQELYEASFKALTERGVPLSAAERASKVVANDNPQLSDLGRTLENQKDIEDAMTWLQAARHSSTKQEH